MKLEPSISKAALATLVGAMLVALPPAMAQEIKLKPGAVSGKQVHTATARDYAYCEIAPVLGTPPHVVAQFYNTTGTTGP